MEVFLNELENRVVFLFLGCTMIATLTEWIAGHFLEWLGHGKWWDYSGKSGTWTAISAYSILSSGVCWA